MLIKGLILAGSADFKTKLRESQNLDYRLREVVLALIDVGYGMEQGFSEAIDKSSHILGNVKHVKEDTLLKEFMCHIERDTGLYCFGVEQTMAMLNCSGVEKLYLYEYLDLRRVTMREAEDEDEEYVFYIKPGQFINSDKFKSKKTGASLIQVEDILLLDYILENSSSFSASIHLISDKTERGTQFVNGLGGIAATLRYKFDVSYMPDFLYEEQQRELAAEARKGEVDFSDDSNDIDAL